MTKEVTFEKRSSVSAGEQLRALINVAMTEQHLAPMVLTAVLEELGKQQKYVSFDRAFVGVDFNVWQIPGSPCYR